ncbi:MAG TPA: helix-turn-helix domain-containing protein [Bacteroidales bacterium]|nr:helix-turn-helix domain-containing protein [Bacteroidales bacterium]
MRFQFFQPSGFLKNYIRNYCIMESDAHEPDVMERVIPIDGIQVMFHFKEPFAEYRSAGEYIRQPRSIISGLSNTYTDVTTYGEAGVIFVRFNSAGACNFFRFPLAELENRSIDLSDVLNKDIRRVEDLLCTKHSYPEKIKVVENFLFSRFSPVPHYDFILMQQAIDLIKNKKGKLDTSILTTKLFVSGKTLERKFSWYLGKTPGQFIRIIRFRETLADITLNKSRNLTGCAYGNGYFDQSHFIRDFKLFTGYTPGEFMRKYPECSVEE